MYLEAAIYCAFALVAIGVLLAGASAFHWTEKVATQCRKVQKEAPQQEEDSRPEYFSEEFGRIRCRMNIPPVPRGKDDFEFS